jgi:AcrR family transcriptional regulator
MVPRPRTTPRKRPRQTRSKDTVEALLEATARVLVKDGYDRASTNKIAKTAGVSIGSLYQYFPSKEALVAALIEQHFDEVIRMITDQLMEAANKPIPEAVRALVTAIIEAKRINPKLHRVIRQQVPRLGRIDRMLDMGAKLEHLVKAQLEIRLEELRIEDVDAAAHVLVHAVDGITNAALFEPHHPIEDDRLIEQMSDLVLRYLLD